MIFSVNANEIFGRMSERTLSLRKGTTIKRLSG